MTPAMLVQDRILGVQIVLDNWAQIMRMKRYGWIGLGWVRTAQIQPPFFLFSLPFTSSVRLSHRSIPLGRLSVIFVDGIAGKFLFFPKLKAC
ncbi:Hypothetical predicted protein [Olea europaea subsp. europaea]|uniref:Uncharacterized protein n=1 Tax=Olea europaea subsp. europaea TaxID=158383 RepID=A0A8S0SRC2_OLEEU|nr:Hypothetical predicted protein [Olea europaea subsp. europaea]